ncbi:hypothetical protein ACNOYE_16820 [Nannocystaceae bacterium ST9]
MKILILILGLATTTLAACEPDPSPEESTVTADGEDSNSDPLHCGERGVQCTGPLGIGECVDGECGARLSECRAGPGTCDEFCAEVGQVCSPLACGEATAWGWSGIPELSDSLCLYADKTSAFPLTVACSDELEGLATTLCCCCVD